MRDRERRVARLRAPLAEARPGREMPHLGTDRRRGHGDHHRDRDATRTPTRRARGTRASDAHVRTGAPFTVTSRSTSPRTPSVTLPRATPSNRQPITRTLEISLRG